MIYYLLGDIYMEKKLCERCNELKEVVLFKNPNKSVCRKCEREKLIQKMNKFESVNLGAENLNTNTDKIQVIGKYFNFNEFISLGRAIELVNNNKAQVYQPETIYFIVDEDNQIVREEVLERDLFICHYCGNYGDTVDHIIPKGQGGEYTHKNLVCCCKKCNFLRKDMDYEEFVKKRKEMLKCKRVKDKIKHKNKKRKGNDQEDKLKIDLMLENIFKPKRKWE